MRKKKRLQREIARKTPFHIYAVLHGGRIFLWGSGIIGKSRCQLYNTMAQSDPGARHFSSAVVSLSARAPLFKQVQFEKLGIGD